MLDYILLAVGVAAAVGGCVWKRKAQARAEAQGTKAKKLPTFLFLFGLWFSVGMLARVFFPNAEKRPFGVEIWAHRVDIGGFSMSQTVLISWAIIAVMLVLCLLIRFLVVPRMKDVPTGLQNALEAAVEAVAKYSRSTGGELGENLPAYIFSLAFFMVLCAAAELFGFRAPTADITLTFSLALVTFFLINYYGIRHKGALGRVKSLAQPTPIVFPFKLISDIAVPVSMACRLFGNMMAGLIVMELIYYALGNFAFGLPSVVGLYFNLFHPFIQIYIFATLTLTFINEAAE